MKYPQLILLAVLLTAGGGYLLLQQNKSADLTPVISPSATTKPANLKFSFPNPQKSPHFESSTPEQASVLAGVPLNVVVNFNFDLGKGSFMEIHALTPTPKIGINDFGIGETVIDENKLSMRKKMDPGSPDGEYSGYYKACWPDGSCHEGYFYFAIDRGMAQGYIDQTGKSEVTIKLSQLKFDPQNIRVSKGTKITWVNGDDTDHYINTDSHPAHTYYPPQNSKLLKKGDNFSLTFDQAAVYPYHCSAHADSMTGIILVE